MSCARTCSLSAAASLALADAVRVRLAGSGASAPAPCASCQFPELMATACPQKLQTELKVLQRHRWEATCKSAGAARLRCFGAPRLAAVAGLACA